MKNLTTLLTLLAFTVSVYAGTGNGGEKPEKKARKVAIMQNQHTAKLIYLNDISDEVWITIYDTDGKKLGASKVNNDGGFIQPFNFQGLPYGEYLLKIEDSDGVSLETFNYKKRESTIKSSVYEINSTNKYRLFVVNSNATPVKLKVYNEDKETVHEEIITEVKSFSKVIDLSKVGGEKFTFQVSNGTDCSFELEK